MDEEVKTPDIEEVAEEPKRKPGRPRKDSYAELQKPWAEVAQDIIEEAKQEPTPEVVEETPAEPEPVVESVAPKPEIDLELLAEKAAMKAKQALQEELQQIQESTRTQAQKEEAIAEIKASWSGDNGNPSDYDEIFNQASDAGFEKAKRWFIAQQEAKQAEEKATQQANEEIARQQENYRLYIQKQAEDEFNRFNAREKLNKEQEHAVFQKGLEINVARQSEGKPPITSIADIYYNYYLPDTKAKPAQVAGVDAPIAGNTGFVESDNNGDHYDYMKDHNKTPREIMAELVNKFKR